ncbi:hypothetical protein D8802_05400 [Streptococcus oralis]|uniref:Uncharacterized protein n=1 Tax=Streptococcus oralis TaxID=1303 RepID=A0A3R9K7D4_STROR|nr:hypothetical protein [Streptococcus oralis]RSJ67466.1 hypothetical protein D8802_05400 [Streptococcus oralis]
MKKSAKVVLLASLLSIGLFQSSVSAKTVLKNYRYDWNIFYESKMNYHAYRYKVIPEWSSYYSYSEYKVGGSWNYARYEVINFYSGGY